MTWKKFTTALAMTGATLAFANTAVAQDAGCAATENCLDQCDSPSDVECIDACISSAEPELAAAYREVFDCFTNSGCDDDDDECVFEACGDTFEALFELCGDEDDPCAENPGEDCCIFANDDECDEPDFCDEGTDTTDCTNFPPGPGCDEEPGPDCCEFANDGECDEPQFCDPGTDTADCSGDPQPDPQPDGNPDAQPDGNPDAQPDAQPDGNPDNNPGNDGDDDGGGGTIDDGCATLPGSSSPGLALLLLIGALAFFRRR